MQRLNDMSRAECRALAIKNTAAHYKEYSNAAYLKSLEKDLFYKDELTAAVLYGRWLEKAGLEVTEGRLRLMFAYPLSHKVLFQMYRGNSGQSPKLLFAKAQRESKNVLNASNNICLTSQNFDSLEERIHLMTIFTRIEVAFGMLSWTMNVDIRTKYAQVYQQIWEGFRDERVRYEIELLRIEKDNNAALAVVPSVDAAALTPEETGSLGVFASKNKIWVSSRDVAVKFEKNHRDVIRSVKNLDCSREFTERNFALSEYKDPTGRTLPQYLMTRDGFTVLAMGFTGPKAARFKEAYIAEFNRMEEELCRRRFCGAAQKKEEPVLELPFERTTFAPVSYEQEYKDLVRKYEIERKKASTAIGNLRASRSNEEKLRHQLNKALDVIAKIASK